MVLDWLLDHLTHFYLKSDFLSYWNSLSPEFENLYTLVTINVTIKFLNTRRESASSKTFQDYISLLLSENLTEAAKSNYSIDSSRNCSEPGTQANDHQDIHTAFCKGLKWEVKFVSKSVINLSRRNLSPPAISLLSKGLKFVPSASKIDRAKLKGERESSKKMEGSLTSCGPFAIMIELLEPTNLDLSLLLIQGIQVLSLKLILVVWRRGF